LLFQFTKQFIPFLILGEKTGFVQVQGPNKYLFPSKYKEAGKHFYNFQSRPDDVWVATYPRSGTTWTQELVWLINNDLDYETASKVQLTERFPFFEFHIFMHDETKEIFLAENAGKEENLKAIRDAATPAYEFMKEWQSPRYFKTHFPFSLMPPSVAENGSKVIYVARNPQDVVVSYFHLNRLYRTQGYQNNFETFYDYFENDLLAWSPYWAHIKEGWAHRHDDNVLFLFYEEMNKDFPDTIRKVAKFLGKAMSEDQIEKLADWLHIKNFKNNEMVNGKQLEEIRILNSNVQGFVRNGKTGGNASELTDDIKRRIKLWTEKNLQETDFRFPC
jgi:hypothetical protein